MLALSGALGEAQLLIDALPEDERGSEAARGALAILGAQDHAGDLSVLERAATANPDDVLARLQLGRALLAAREVEKGVAELFEAARRDVGFQGGEPRKAMLEAFAALGEEHPLTKEFRRKLSVLLCG
jgi:putative thioredoxin